MSKKDIFDTTWSIVHLSCNPCDDLSRYSVTDWKVLQVEIKLNYIKEVSLTPLIEYLT